MEIDPVDSWFHRIQNGPVGEKNGLVNESLLLIELSADRKAAGDVGSVAKVFGSHVKEGNVIRTKETVVGLSSMSIVQDARIVSRGADAVISAESTSTVKVAIVMKEGFELILHHSRTSVLHDVNVTLR